MKSFLGWFIGIALIGYGAYYLLFAGAGTEGVQIAFKSPDKIAYGAPFELIVAIGNSSGKVLKNASFSLSLPTGYVFGEERNSTGFIAKQLGDVSIGSFTELPFTVMAVAHIADSANAAFSYGAVGKGDETASPTAPLSAFEAQISYLQDGGPAVFEKKEQWSPPTPSSAFELSVTAPKKVASGEEMAFTVVYANKTGGDLNNLVVRVAYPPSFVFVSASADPDMDESVWNIGSLKNGSSDSFVVKGRITSVESANFAVSVARSAGSVKYPIAVAQATVIVMNPPLALFMDVNDTPEYVARLGDTLSYTLSYTMEDGFTVPRGGMTITADLLSPLFDATTVMPSDGGSFGRGPNGVPRVSWRIAKPDPEGGSVSFSVKVKNDYDIRRLGDRNFILTVHGEVAAGTTVGALDYETKLAGKITVASQGYFRDARSGIVNKGSMPPAVGALTEYTAHWKIVNYATDARGITVRATLPQGVSFTGSVKSNRDAKPAYDATSREVVWKIDRIAATTGLIGTAPEAIFQLRSVPTVDMKGKQVPLLGITDISATDDFTGATITATAPEITSALPDDATAAGQGIVQ